MVIHRDGKLPVIKVGFFSYIFMSWLSPLIWKMFKNRLEPIKESDIWECSDEEGVRLNSEGYFIQTLTSKLIKKTMHCFLLDIVRYHGACNIAFNINIPMLFAIYHIDSYCLMDSFVSKTKNNERHR